MSKIELQDYVKFGKLFDLYGKLLSEDRQKTMESYFQFNMTLAEIAKERQISRQAVLDSIDKSCKKLQAFEEALKLYENSTKLSADLEELKRLAEKTNQKQIAEKVEEILRKM